MAEDHKHEHHGHVHSHGPTTNRTRLILVLCLTIVYMLAEAAGGFFTNSLALFSDAGHMLTDVAALLLAILALWFTSRPVTTRKTYGYYRMEILAALANGVALILISLLICFEALHRIRAPEGVRGLELTIIATGGLIVNGISALLLRPASEHNLNMRGAFLHVMADALGSIGAIIAGLLIWQKGWLIADPIFSLIMCVLIVYSSWKLIRDSVNVLLEGTPSHIDVDAVIKAIQREPGIQEVHDLHVWTISSGKDALSAHVRLAPDASPRSLLNVLQERLSSEFNIGHVTIQLEMPEESEEQSGKLYQISPRPEAPADAPGSTGGFSKPVRQSRG